jgi:UDP-N-acetylglucosamine--N-acetylmuramyl-(pentapeptide) pyrophosphoryl-undecaprenol N-acetylglucosamine transferase
MTEKEKGKEKVLVLAGGGTGGHVHAGIAIADEWRKKYGPDSKVYFLGTKGRIEERIVPKYGYRLFLLKLGSLNQVGLFEKLKTAFLLPLSFLTSTLLLLKWRPTHVVGVGGYVSGPFVLMAALLGKVFKIRTAILEQNSFPGMTNRWLGRFVDQIFIAFEEAKSHFKTDKEMLLTGNPIRSHFEKLGDPASAPFVIFSFGGSQGAFGMNTLIIDSLAFLKDLRDEIHFIHQTGEFDYDRVKMAYEGAGLKAEVSSFIYDMKSAYEEASLVICRSGSSTLAELAAVGRPAILVPLPTAADDHQAKNAQALVNAGAAWMVPQRDIRPEEFAAKIREAYLNPDMRTLVSEKVLQFHRPEAASLIVGHLTL